MDETKQATMVERATAKANERATARALVCRGLNAAEDSKLAGFVSVAEAHDILDRFIASHFRRDGCERARFSIPANPARDDDIRLSAFIEQSRPLRQELDRLRRSLGLPVDDDPAGFRELDDLRAAVQRFLAAGVNDDPEYDMAKDALRATYELEHTPRPVREVTT